jgi:hypothetical protein
MAYPDIDAAQMQYRTGLGATDGSASANPPGKLWLPVWSGEVINAYDQYNMFEKLVDSKVISSGRQIEIPITGTVALKTAWGAGEELLGGDDSLATTFRVTLDKRPMAAHFELDNIDLMITQWEYRAELARQAGMTLANARDKQLAAYIARACAEDGLTNGGPTPKVPFGDTKYANLDGGAGVTTNDIEDACLLLLFDIENWLVYLQENHIPTDGVYCAVPPQAFSNIRSLGIARDNADMSGGAGRPMFGGVMEAGGLGVGLDSGLSNLTDTMNYQGVTILKSNHMPANYVATADNIGEARYNLKFPGSPGTANEAAALKALLWQQKAVAGIRLQGLKVDTVDDIRRNTVFTVASMMAGTGTVRPECACAVTDETVTGGTSGSAANTRAYLRGAWGMATEYAVA